MRLLKRSSPIPAVRGRYHLNTNDILPSRNLDYFKKKLVICLASFLLLKCKQNYDNTIWYPIRVIIIIIKKEIIAISIGKLEGSCISDGNIQQCSQDEQHLGDSLPSSPYHHHDLAIPPLCMCLKLSVHIPTYIVLKFSKQHYLSIPE